MKNYDIFISYRRIGTGDKAEHLKDLLDPHYGGRISFDRENLTGLFATALIDRIDNCKDFILVIGKSSFNFKPEDFEADTVSLYKYLASCTREEFKAKIMELGPNAGLDFVRIEVSRALNRKDINIIPLAPQSTNDFSFSKLELPEDIVGIKSYEAIFYSDNADALFKDVVPKLRPHLKSKPDMPFKRLIMLLAASAVLAALVFSGWKIHESKVKKQILEEAAKAEEIISEKGMSEDIGQYLNCSPYITMRQIQAVNAILHDMEKVEGGTFMQGAAPNNDGSYDDDVYMELETPQIEKTVETFYISQREVSVSDWHEIHGLKYDRKQADRAMNEISFDECSEFVQMLKDLTGLDFNIPDEAQWEYAARGGAEGSETKYSGSDSPHNVAWFEENSHGQITSESISNSRMDPNELGLFNMSGNVSEWCSEVFKPYDPAVKALNATDMVIRGGSFESPSYELTVYHRSPMNPSEKSPSTGLRLVISK